MWNAYHVVKGGRSSMKTASMICVVFTPVIPTARTGCVVDGLDVACPIEF